MKKKASFWFLLVTLFLISSNVSVSAAIKPGTVCKTLGITSISSGKTYTCIKSGKKLVWDNGKTVSSKIIINLQKSLGKLEFGGVAISEDGSKLIVSESCAIRDLKGKCEKFGSIYTSSDFGVSWTKQTNAGVRYWKGVATSSDGSILHAVAYPGGIYRSEDFGITWKNLTCCDRYWWSVASSLDGQKIIAAEYIIPQGFIATSSDGGKTFIERKSAGARDWYKVASSGDGSKMIAIDISGYLYLSDDSGVNWKAINSTGQKNWGSIDISDDGSVIALVAENSNIMISTDFGSNWFPVLSLPNKKWNSVAVSGNGIKIFALGDHGQGLYFSENSGKTWKKWNTLINPGNGELVIAKNGNRMVSIPMNGYLNTYVIN